MGSYKDYRRRSAKVEKEVGWAGKVPKLFWRGSMRVGTADRESMKQMADGHSWNDVQEVVWGGKSAQLGLLDKDRSDADLSFPRFCRRCNQRSLDGGPLSLEIPRLPRR